MVELTVILKDSEKSYRQKFLMYDEFLAIPHDPQIMLCVEEAKKSFGSEPEDVRVKISMEM